MTTNWFIALLGFIEPIALFGTVGMLLWRRLAASWPSLAIALSVELLTDVTLVYLWHTPGHYKAYFYTYWISTAFQSAIRMWIMADIVRSFPGAGYLSGRVYLFVGATCTVMGLCSGWLCYDSTAHKGLDVISTVILLDRCVNTAWVAFIAVLLGGVKLFAFGWSPLGARVANGVFFRICAAAVTVEMMNSHFAWVRGVGNVLSSCSSIAAFAFWAFHLFHYVPESVEVEVTAPSSNMLETLESWARK